MATLLLLVLCVSCSVLGSAGLVDYSAAQLLRLSNTSLEDMESIKAMEDAGDLEIMASTLDTVDILLSNDLVVNVKEELDSMNMTYKVMCENVQDTITLERETSVANTTDTCNKGDCFDWTKYYRLDNMYQYLDFLQDRYPGQVTVITVGLSAEQRPIKLVKMSSGTNQSVNAVWVDGGVHAREWISPAAALYIAAQTAASLHTLPDLTYYVLPVLNPDGYEYSHTTDRLWRKNRSVHNGSDCVGTDPNRNWAHHWGGADSTANPCSSNYRGAAPFSEPETAAMSSYMLNTTGIKGYLSLHSYGQNILFPWAYSYPRPKDYKDLYNLAYLMAYNVKNTTGAYYRYGTAAETYYIASGGSQDWVKAEAKVQFAYTMELRDTGSHGFSLPTEEILPTCKDAFAAFTVLSEKVYKT